MHLVLDKRILFNFLFKAYKNI